MPMRSLTVVARSDGRELRFDFHPSVRRLALFWNAPQMWKALTSDSERPKASVQAEAAQWLLWREELQTYFRSLQACEAQAFDAARTGSSFGELCAGLARHFTDAETPAAPPAICGNGSIPGSSSE